MKLGFGWDTRKGRSGRPTSSGWDSSEGIWLVGTFLVGLEEDGIRRNDGGNDGGRLLCRREWLDNADEEDVVATGAGDDAEMPMGMLFEDDAETDEPDLGGRRYWLDENSDDVGWGLFPDNPPPASGRLASSSSARWPRLRSDGDETWSGRSPRLAAGDDRTEDEAEQSDSEKKEDAVGEQDVMSSLDDGSK